MAISFMSYFSCFNKFRGITSPNLISRYIFCYHSASTNNGTITNSNRIAYYGVCSNKYILSYCDSANFKSKALARGINVVCQDFNSCSYGCSMAYVDVLRSNGIYGYIVIDQSAAFNIYPPIFNICALCCGSIGSFAILSQKTLYKRRGGYILRKSLSIM